MLHSISVIPITTEDRSGYAKLPLFSLLLYATMTISDMSIQDSQEDTIGGDTFTIQWKALKR